MRNPATRGSAGRGRDLCSAAEQRENNPATETRQDAPFPSDLYREHDAALHRVRDHHFAALTEHGIDGNAYVVAGYLGIDHVELTGSVYWPQPAGIEAFIVPVLEGDEIADLCAISLDKPGRWALRRDVGFALGDDAIGFAYWHHKPLELHATPVAWLKAGCRGACLLRPADAWSRLGHLEAVTVADVGHGNAVERILTPPRPRLDILVRAEA